VLKVNQFLTAGMGSMIYGCMRYYFCVLFGEVSLYECTNLPLFAPYLIVFCGIDFLGSFVLTQLGLCAFHWSRVTRPVVNCAEGQRVVPEPELLDCCICCGGCKISHPAPLRLRMLVRYDGVCFAFSVFIMVLFSICSWGRTHHDTAVFQEQIPILSQHPTLVLNLYWCRVLYAFLTVPWLFVWVPDFAPITFSLITQTARTGYNKEGVCVPFNLAAQRQRRKSKRLPDLPDEASMVSSIASGGMSDDSCSEDSGASTSSAWAAPSSTFWQPWEALRNIGGDWRTCQ